MVRRRRTSRVGKAPVWWETGAYCESLAENLANGTLGGAAIGTELLESIDTEPHENEVLTVLRTVGRFYVHHTSAAGAEPAVAAPIKWRLCKGAFLAGTILYPDLWSFADAEQEFLTEGVVPSLPAAGTIAGRSNILNGAVGLDRIAAGSDVAAWDFGAIDCKVQRRIGPSETLSLVIQGPPDATVPGDLIFLVGWVRCLVRIGA